MSVLYWLEGIRMPVLNEFMQIITKFGEESAFLVIALVFFWCVDKRRGYLLMSVGFLGTMVNQFLKLWFRVPRPWVLDENFTILEAAREAASGYSFPSGHTTSAVGTFGSIAATTPKRWMRVLCITIAALVGISRMYMGVHTPQDVLVGALTSIVLILLLRSPVMSGGRKRMNALVAFMLAMALGLLWFVEQYPFPADVDVHNLESGIKNAYTMIGCLTGVAMVYLLEEKYIHFSTDAVWWAQILKAVLGLGAVLLVKEGLRAPLEALLPAYPARALRYFLIVVTAGILWPITFKWFSKLGKKAEETT